MSRLSAKSAKEIMKARQDSFDRTMKTIRGMIDSSIKDAAKKGKKSVTINVPASVWGHEPYNLAEMGKELANQLFSDEYFVTGTYAKMTICWDTAPSSAAKSKKETTLIKVPKPKIS